MPFVFTPTHNPYVGSISELMLAPAEARARAFQQSGQAQANAALLGGQAWADAAHQIGYAGAHLADTIAQQHSPQTQLQNLALAKAKEMQAGQQRMDTLMTPYQPNGPQPEGAGPAAPQQPYLDANGLYDVPKLGEALAASGMAHLSPDLLKSAQMINDSIVEHQQRQSKLADAETVMYGDMAASVQKLVKTGMPFDEALKLATAPGLATGRIDPKHFAPIAQQLLSAPPEQQMAALGTLMDAASKISGNKTLAKDATEIDRYGRTEATNVVPEKPTPASLAADAATLGTPQETKTAAASKAALGLLPQEANQAETARHNQAMEAISKQNVGREVAAQAETARHNKAMEQAANPLGMGMPSAPAAAGGPGAPTPPPAGPSSLTQANTDVRPDVLAKLPPTVASTVQALADGRMAFPSGFALSKPYWQQMIALVGQYDPSFDAVNYNARWRTRQDFTSGKSSQTINALNTVAQHLDRLSTSADALNNTWSPTYNTIANFLSKQTGNKEVTNFETDKKAVVDELTRAWRQSGGTEGDIKSWSSVLDAANSPTQLHAAIGEMGQLLEGKLSALQAQYQQGMGSSAGGIQVIKPEARQVLDRLETKAGGSAATTAPASQKTLSVQQIQQMADLAKTTYAEAKKHAESNGYTVK